MKQFFTIATIMLLLTHGAIGQYEQVTEARRLYQEKKYAEAKERIDAAMQDPTLSQDAYSWLIRGYIYKDVYKKLENSDPSSKAREGALEFAMKAMELDTTKDQVFFSDGYKLYDHLAKTYYNDAARAMNSMDHESAVAHFERYKKTIMGLSPDADLDEKQVEFYNALATVYTKLYNKDREDLTFFKKAIATYQEVLYIDQSNYGANYNMATMWYNRGVYNIQLITPDNDIPSINRIQEVSKEFFLEALPFMHKAYGFDATRKEVLLGLEGIYYSLQDTEKSERYKQEYEALYGADR